MDLFELLPVPEAFVGVLAGLCLAALVHWMAPEPEPLLMEAGLVALGFVGGLLVSLVGSSKGQGKP